MTPSLSSPPVYIHGQLWASITNQGHSIDRSKPFTVIRKGMPTVRITDPQNIPDDILLRTDYTDVTVVVQYTGYVGGEETAVWIDQARAAVVPVIFVDGIAANIPESAEA